MRHEPVQAVAQAILVLDGVGRGGGRRDRRGQGDDDARPAGLLADRRGGGLELSNLYVGHGGMVEYLRRCTAVRPGRQVFLFVCDSRGRISRDQGGYVFLGLGPL